MQIKIRQLKSSELQDFWQLAFSDPKAEWTQWNGPYFHDHLPSKNEFLTYTSQRYLHDPFCQVISVDDQIVGEVSAHYVDGSLQRWLEVGIVIYAPSQWHQGIGKQALRQWLTKVFDQIALPHIGLTTWSGNLRMIHLAESLGLKKEAEIRQVRFWQNRYWNSVKYGILRKEWQQKNHHDVDHPTK
ncbi:GNAT family N-acetyltransferase [Agrilactobacillus fermenti]|uniref:GNAT family N-acetyltransferase n=1 Tax=Agrilactobacillus fermenti TaxID=2586909 RepID=UPI001E5E0A6A|nr:GNAT family protein [Agrilactobacillus fermenti]MCD2256741.1 GNAT family N-acetyltransferase [Agrilactobacillus fermenti]